MRKYKSEKFDYTDKETGAAVTRLTSWRTNSNHLYFTNNSFYDNGKRIVFSSERENEQNLYSMDLETGEIDQLTDFGTPDKYPGDNSFLLSYVDYNQAKCVFYYNRELRCIDLKTREQTTICNIPDGYGRHIVSIGADGKYAYTSFHENTSARRKGNTLQDVFDSHPHSMIMQVALDGSSSKVIYEENNFIAHVNASPTNPDILTFCHEGYWDEVDHRLWGLDIKTGKEHKIHMCKPGEAIGHEYWFADGKRLGYHGVLNSYRSGPGDENLHGDRQLGAVDFDNTNDVSYEFPFHTGHIFSNDEMLIVGDGDRVGRYLRLWKLGSDGYEAPRALCLHQCTFKMQTSHVHPRITPDGKAILYTSDMSGYNQLYLVKIPDNIDDLPLLSELSEY